MTFHQPVEFKAHVWKGETGNLVVYADKIARHETDADTAAFVCANLNLTPKVREDHAAYIASWIKVLKRDKGASFCAASHAQRAANFLHDEREGAADGAGESHTLAKLPKVGQGEDKDLDRNLTGKPA